MQILRQNQKILDAVYVLEGIQKKITDVYVVDVAIEELFSQKLLKNRYIL